MNPYSRSDFVGEETRANSMELGVRNSENLKGNLPDDKNKCQPCREIGRGALQNRLSISLYHLNLFQRIAFDDFEP